MMTGLHVAKVELSVKVAVPVALLQKHLPAPIDKLGAQLAEETHKVVMRDSLGYYPALDYFKESGAIPGYLLDAVDEVATLATALATDQINEMLVPVFSNVTVNSVQCLAFALPTVRPGKPNAREELASHYTPNVLKLELIVSVLQKHEPEESFERYADNTVFRLLGEVFESVEISSARLLPENDE
jgi:hypothetical protein